MIYVHLIFHSILDLKFKFHIFICYMYINKMKFTVLILLIISGGESFIKMAFPSLSRPTFFKKIKTNFFNIKIDFHYKNNNKKKYLHQ